MTVEKLRRIAIMASLAVIGLGMGAYIWVLFGGSDSQGNYQPQDFATLSYTPVQSGFLACQPDVCRAATPDRPAFEILAPLDRVRTAIATLADSDPEIVMRRFDVPGDQYDLTFFQRDIGRYQVIAVTIRADGTDTRASIYSFQPVGDSDKGAHRERAFRFLERLKAVL